MSCARSLVTSHLCGMHCYIHYPHCHYSRHPCHHGFLLLIRLSLQTFVSFFKFFLVSFFFPRVYSILCFILVIAQLCCSYWMWHIAIFNIIICKMCLIIESVMVSKQVSKVTQVKIVQRAFVTRSLFAYNSS